MKNFGELRSIAEVVGCGEKVRIAESAAAALQEQKRVKVVVTGMRGSGKTTLINRMVGSEIREPGNMDDNEKALRVSFERMEDDDRYDCKLVVNHEWNSRETILYELRDHEVFDGKALTQEMDDKDVVLFLISATAPFNINEVNILKALSHLQRQVILTGLDVVKEGEREKVKEYVEKLNASLSLPPIYVLDEASDVGRDLRNLLPVWGDLPALREKHADAIFDKALNEVQSVAKQTLDTTEQQLAASSSNTEAEEACKKAKANWYTLRTELLERQNKVSVELTDGLKTAGDAAVERLLKSGREAKFSEEWQKSSSREANDAYQKIFVARLDALRDEFVKDVRKASADANFLKLMGYSQSDFATLEKYAPQAISKASETDGGKFNAPAVSRMPSMSDDSFKIMVGTAVVAGGFVFMPLPTAARFVGVAASAGVGGVMAANKRSQEIESEFENAYRAAFKKNMTSMEGNLLEAASNCYGKAIQFMHGKEDSLQAAKADLTPLLEQKQKLEDCLKVCESLRQ